MAKQSGGGFSWTKIGKILRQQKKDDLIDLLEELATISPDVQRFLQTRYLKKENVSDRIAPYRDPIQSQFVVSEWNNSASWDFAGVKKSLDDYARSRPDDKVGLVELLIHALESSLAFADQLNLQDFDFDEGVTELAERYMTVLASWPEVQPQYNQRLKKIRQTADELGYYALVEILET